jgi:hypothetical protein
VKTEKEELQQLKAKWSFNKKMALKLGEPINTLEVFYNYSAAGISSVWVRAKNIKEIAMCLNNLKPVNTTSAVYYQETIDSPYLCRITNPHSFHASDQAEFWIDTKIASNVNFWIMTPIKNLPELINGKEECKSVLFQPASYTPPETAMVHYPGMTRAEVSRIRVPGYRFAYGWKCKEFYGGAATMNDTRQTLEVIEYLKKCS